MGSAAGVAFEDEGLLGAVAEAALGVAFFLFCKVTRGRRYLRAVEELARQRQHAVHEVGLGDGLANLALAGLVGGHAAIGKDEAGHAVGREVVDEMLHPSEVGVARRWRAILTSRLLFGLSAPQSKV